MSVAKAEELFSPDGSVTTSQIKDWEVKVSNDPKLHLIRTIQIHATIPNVLASSTIAVAISHVFNLSLSPIRSPAEGSDCLKLRKCLLYIEELELEEFQLSQVHVHSSTRSI